MPPKLPPVTEMKEKQLPVIRKIMAIARNGAAKTLKLSEAKYEREQKYSG